MIKASNLKSVLNRNKWLRKPTAIVAAITMPFLWVILTLGENISELKGALGDAWDLFIGNVEEDV